MVAPRRFHLIYRRLSAQARETGCQSVTWHKTYESMGSGNEFRMRFVPRLSNRTEGFDISIKSHQPLHDVTRASSNFAKAITLTRASEIIQEHQLLVHIPSTI